MASYQLILEAKPDEDNVRAVKHGLFEFNNLHAEPEHWQPLALYVREDGGKIVGGLLGYTHWRWLYVENLWVAEGLRGEGYGQMLMRGAEEEARSRGCRHAYLDTFDFQALGFYRKLGYEVFGQLEDYPPGHVKYFLQKRSLNP